MTGYRYVVALPDHQLEKIGVKIGGKQRLEKPEGFEEAEFTGLELMVYEAQGHAQIQRQGRPAIKGKNFL